MAQMVHNKTTQALYAWGSNASGLLGLGDYEDRKQPEHNEKINFGIQLLNSGGCNTVIVNDQNEVYVAGENKYGLLGLDLDDDAVKKATFTKIPSLFVCKIQKVSCGWWHAMAIGEHGKSLFGWGWNKYGQLGIDATTIKINQKIIKPTKIRVNIDVVKNSDISFVEVSCGWKHSVLLSNTGIIYTCGSNINGQLGRKIENTNSNNNNNNSTNNKKNVNNNNCHIFSKVYIENIIIEKDIKYRYRGTMITCGWTHSAVLGYFENSNDKSRIDNKTNIYTWGSNKFFQLGRQLEVETLCNNSTPRNYRIEPGQVNQLNGHNVINIKSGWSHMLALTNNGVVYSWGRNDFGQCGTVGNNNNNNNNNKSLCKYSGIDKIISLTSIQNISCGSEHSAAVDMEGNLYTWGWNEHFNLGHTNNIIGLHQQKFSSIPTNVAKGKNKIIHVECGGATTFIIRGIP